MQKRNATCAVIGAGDYIGAEIAKKFAAEGFTVFAGRRNGEKLEPLVKEVEATGGTIFGRSLDARNEAETTAFLNEADQHAPLEVCIFNVGANVNFPILETTDRVFRKVWEMACWAGFVAGRESARLMVPRGQGNIFFTGATASLRGGSGYAAFASAKFGLRAVAQAMARIRSDILPSRSPKLSDCIGASCTTSRASFSVAAMAQRPPSTRSRPNFWSSASRCDMPLSSGIIEVFGPIAGAKDLMASSRSKALQLNRTMSNLSESLSA